MTSDDSDLLAASAKLMNLLWERMLQAEQGAPDPEELWLILALAARFAERGVESTARVFNTPELVTATRERLARLMVLCDARSDASDAKSEGPMGMQRGGQA